MPLGHGGIHRFILNRRATLRPVAPVLNQLIVEGLGFQQIEHNFMWKSRVGILSSGFALQPATPLLSGRKATRCAVSCLF